MRIGLKDGHAILSAERQQGGETSVSARRLRYALAVSKNMRRERGIQRDEKNARGLYQKSPADVNGGEC